MADVWDIAAKGLASPSPTPTGDPWDIAEKALATPTSTPSGTPEYRGFQFNPQSGTQADVGEGREVAQPAVDALGDIPYARGLGTELLRQIPTSAGQAGEAVTGVLGNPYASVIDDLTQEPQKIAGVYRGLEEGKPLAQAVEDVLGRPKTYPEFNAEDWGRFTGQLGVAASQALPFLGGLGELLPGVESHVIEPQIPEPPPTQSLGPGTTARDVSNALDWTPQSAPITPLEEAVSKVQPPGPQVSPETGFTIYPGLEGHQPVPSDWAYPVPPPGTDLKPVALRGPNGSTPAADAAQAQPQAAPQPAIPPGDERYAGVTPAPGAAQPQSVSHNVAGFEQTFGQGEIPAGPTISQGEAWAQAEERSKSGKAQPYGFVARAQSGAITPEEMGDLIYEDHALMERAAGLEGTAGYPEALAASKNFASNVLKPAENAWHRSGMTMQIKRPVNYSSVTAIDAAATRMGNELKASEVSQAKRVARENANANNGAVAAGNRVLEAMDKEYHAGRDVDRPRRKNNFGMNSRA